MKVIVIMEGVDARELAAVASMMERLSSFSTSEPMQCKTVPIGSYTYSEEMNCIVFDTNYQTVRQQLTAKKSYPAFEPPEPPMYPSPPEPANFASVSGLDLHAPAPAQDPRLVELIPENVPDRDSNPYDDPHVDDSERCPDPKHDDDKLDDEQISF